MRGDRPFCVKLLDNFFVFTPHARGSTSLRTGKTKDPSVYPACAGIDPVLLGQPRQIFRLPRMRGDRPQRPDHSLILCQFTPHARGSTSDKCFAVLRGQVYPACAGIDLSLPPMIAVRTRLPRMRGDRPRSQRI